MATIPTGFPGRDNLATIRRGVSAGKQAFAGAQRQQAQAREEARGIQQFGGTLVDIAGAVQRQDIRLNKQQQADLEKAQRDSARAARNKGHAASTVAWAEVKATAKSENRPIGPEDYAFVQSAVEGVFDEGEYALAIEDQDTADAFAAFTANATAEGISYNVTRELQEAQDDNTDAFYVALNANDVAGMDAALEFEGYNATQRQSLLAQRDATVVTMGVESKMGRIFDIALDETMESEDAVVAMNAHIESTMKSENVSRKVKDQFAREASTAVARYRNRRTAEDQLGAKEQLASQQANMVALDDRAQTDLTIEEINNLYETQQETYGLTPESVRRLKATVRAREAAAAQARTDYADVNALIASGNMDNSADLQKSVDNVFEGSPSSPSPYATQYANWSELSQPEKVATLNLANTGMIPSKVTNELSAARSTNNPDQVQKAYEVYTLLEHTATTDQVLAVQVPEKVRNYWDSVEKLVRADWPLHEAKRVVDERLAMPPEERSIRNQRYVEDTKGDSNRKAMVKYIDEDNYFEGADVGRSVEGLYEGLVHSNYSNNGGDLEAAQKTAFKSLTAIISTSNVNGVSELMTPAPESVYGLTPQQIQDDVIKDASEFLSGAFGATPELRLTSDPRSLQGKGWQVEFRVSDDQEWAAVTDDRNVPMRWTYERPSALARQETTEARADTLRQREEEFNAMSRDDKMKFGSTNPRGEYLKMRQNEENAESDAARGVYFRDS